MRRAARILRIALAAAAALGIVAALAGCQAMIPPTEGSQSGPEQNRQYMSSLTQSVSDIATISTEFQEAVAKQDVVTMKAKVDEVKKVVSELASKEAPDALAGVKEGYVGALESLTSSMQDYTGLYDDLKAGRIDETAFSSRLSQIQSTYDAGIAALKAADSAVLSLAEQGSDSGSSK